jgi:endogenous inhibitor of DNA gyrase (YacG/DUF329 family)
VYTGGVRKPLSTRIFFRLAIRYRNALTAVSRPELHALFDIMTVVNCPTCSAKVEWTEENKYRPFCSNRCKQIDLGAWAEEKYKIPAADPVDETLEDEEPKH